MHRNFSVCGFLLVLCITLSSEGRSEETWSEMVINHGLAVLEFPVPVSIYSQEISPSGTGSYEWADASEEIFLIHDTKPAWYEEEDLGEYLSSVRCFRDNGIFEQLTPQNNSIRDCAELSDRMYFSYVDDGWPCHYIIYIAPDSLNESRLFNSLKTCVPPDMDERVRSSMLHIFENSKFEYTGGCKSNLIGCRR
jgi:hypothetical protein